MKKYTPETLRIAIENNSIEHPRLTPETTILLMKAIEEKTEALKAAALREVETNARLAVAEKDFQEILRLTLTKNDENNHRIGFIQESTMAKVLVKINGFTALMKSRIGEGQDPKGNTQFSVWFYLGDETSTGNWTYRPLSCLRPQDKKLEDAVDVSSVDADEMPD